MNEVRLSGTVKHDITMREGAKAIGFTLEVEDDGYVSFIDCTAVSGTQAFDALEGFANKGERMTLTGRLRRRTVSAEQFVGGARVTVKNTTTIVEAEEIEMED